jgi:hypothetical protein
MIFSENRFSLFRIMLKSNIFREEKSALADFPQLCVLMRAVELSRGLTLIRFRRHQRCRGVGFLYDLVSVPIEPGDQAVCHSEIPRGVGTGDDLAGREFTHETSLPN